LEAKFAWLAGAFSCALIGACSASDSGARTENNAAGTGKPSTAGTIANPSGVSGSGGSSNPGIVPVTPDIPSVPPPPLAPQGDRDLVRMNECPGAVSPAQVTELSRADLQPGTNKWLYPYERTVFPRGLTAPLLQWDAPVAEVVRVRMQSMLFEYEGCFAGGAVANLPIPQAAWDKAAEQSLGASDPLTVELTLISMGTTVRLPKLSLLFALATLKSAVYYNTYGSPIANQAGIIGGVVMRVLPGKATPDVFLSAPSPATHCVGCHSVSADGSRMVAEVHAQPGIIEANSASFDLTTVGTGTNPQPLHDNLLRAGFSGLYPDGSVYLTTGRIGPGPIGPLPGGPVGNVAGTFGPEISKLYDTNSGIEIPGSGIIDYAYMPQFSVDGAMIAFNEMVASGAAAGHSLAVMNYDHTAKKFTQLKRI
jgi:hypothetical protein